MHSNEHYQGPSQWFGNKGKGHCVTEGSHNSFGNMKKDILFSFQNQSNNGTGNPCEGLITDLTEGSHNGFGNMKKDILFSFQNQSNNGTGNPCEGLITDLSLGKLQ